MACQRAHEQMMACAIICQNTEWQAAYHEHLPHTSRVHDYASACAYGARFRMACTMA